MFEVVIMGKLKVMRSKIICSSSLAYIIGYLYCRHTDQYCFLILGDLLKYLRETKDCMRLCIIALSIESEANMVMLTALFNNEAYHSPSVALAVLDNILFKSLSGANASLTVSNKPQPLPDIEDNEEYVILFF